MKRFLAVFAALLWATGAIAQGYTIKSGDTLNIEVLEDPALNRQVLVLPDGSVSFPLVGSISASGLSTDAFQARLASALAPNFASTPSVFASVASVSDRRATGTGTSSRSRTIDVYVMGEVNTPGLAEVSPRTSLLQMLALTGGFTKFAATKRIQLRRVDPQTGAYVTYVFNYRAVESGAAITGSTRMRQGDVIVVPQRKLFE